MSDSSDRLLAGLLALLVVGGAVARLTLLGEPMRYDEAFTFLNYAMQPIGHIVATYDFPNNHVLYSLSAHFSWRAFGDHVRTVRLPAFAAGVALIPAAYLAARALYDRWAGIWAAALVTGSASLIAFSVNGRGYTLGTLLIVLALWVGARLVERSRTREWIALVVLFALAVYTVPTMAAGVATVAAWMAGTALLRREGRDMALVVRVAVAVAVAAGLSLLLYSGMLGQAGWTFVKSVPTDWTPLTDVAERVWRAWNQAQPHPLDWLVATGFVTALALHRRIARHPVPIAVAALAAMVGVVAVGKVSPFPRTFLYLLPLYLIQASGGLSYLFGRASARLPRRALATGAAALLVAGALVAAVLHAGQSTAEQAPSSDNDLVGFLKRHVHPREAVLLQPFTTVAASYYFHRYGYQPPTLPAHRMPYRALVLLSRTRSHLSSPHAVVRDVGWAIRPGARPRLVARLPYLTAWEVDVE
jgi:hypothetical protein